MKTTKTNSRVAAKDKSPLSTEGEDGVNYMGILVGSGEDAVRISNNRMHATGCDMTECSGECMPENKPEENKKPMTKPIKRMKEDERTLRMLGSSVIAVVCVAATRNWNGWLLFDFVVAGVATTYFVVNAIQLHRGR